jgi:Zn-dependent protease with chaperone function
MRSAFLALVVALGLAGCVVVPPPAPAPPVPPGAERADIEAAAERAATNFVTVVERVEPVAERECRARAPELDCDFQIFVDDRRGAPPNAFQTVDRRGRPAIVFTLPLIADAANQDELAFILGHEASHHILGHIPRARANAELGARVLGGIAEAAGQNRRAVEAAAQVGAEVGARRFAREFELEADELGTIIAFRAGYDPVRGAQFFARIPDPGDTFLATHPPNAARQDLVARTAAALR